MTRSISAAMRGSRPRFHDLRIHQGDEVACSLKKSLDKLVAWLNYIVEWFN